MALIIFVGLLMLYSCPVAYFQQVSSVQVQTGEGGDLLDLFAASGKQESPYPAVFRGGDTEKDCSHRFFRCPSIRSGDSGDRETDISAGFAPYSFRHRRRHLCTDRPVRLDEGLGHIQVPGFHAVGIGGHSSQKIIGTPRDCGYLMGNKTAGAGFSHGHGQAGVT